MYTSVFNAGKLGEVIRVLVAIALGMCLYAIVAAVLSANLSIAQNVQLWLLYGLLPWALLLPVLLVVLRHLATKPLARTRMLAGLGVFALFVLLHAALIALLSYVSAQAEITTRWREGGLLLVDSGMLLFDVLVFAMLAARAVAQELRKQLKQRDEDAWRLNRSLSDTKMQSLMMQLNPHFLFNTLNGLAVLIDKRENEAARAMLGELSGFLRRILRSKVEKWVTLEAELEFIRQYLRIEQYRFGKRLVWFEDCEPLAMSARIPAMLLQPLFENAIVHGLADKQGECRLGFECRLYDRNLILTIFDNGENFDAMQDPLGKGGIGLTNVQARLRELYGANSSLVIEKKTDGTLVTLKLPAYKDSQF